MKCTTVALPSGGMATVCGRDRIQTCTQCGAAATKLCDWKTGQDRTCDAALCDAHAVSPAPNKDLCPRHAAAWEEIKAQRAGKSAHQDPR